MKLIAKNKIAAYIEKCPEARIELLTWLEQYPSQAGREQHYDHYKNHTAYPCCISGSASPGGGDHVLLYQINLEAKTCCITSVSSKAQIDQEFKTMREMHAGQATKITTVKVVVAPPPPRDQESIEDPATTELQDEQTTFVLDDDLPDGQVSELTEVEYEERLARAIAIFEAIPNTPEFNELLSLLPSIHNYEAYKLKFPIAYTFEIAALRMNLFQLTPRDLAGMVGSTEDEINLFLSGQLNLDPKVSTKLYKHLNIPIPVNNGRFIR